MCRVCCIPQSVTVPGKGTTGTHPPIFRQLHDGEFAMSQVMSWMSRAARHGGFCFRLMTTLSREIARPVFRPRAIDGRRRWSRSVRESVPGMNSVHRKASTPEAFSLCQSSRCRHFWALVILLRALSVSLGAGRQPATLIGPCGMHPFLAASGLRHSRPSSAAQARVQLLQVAAKIAAVTDAHATIDRRATVIIRMFNKCNPGISRS